MTTTLGKPQSHSDVINKHPSTLLIGYGWVGQYVHQYFTEADYYSPSLGLHFNTEIVQTNKRWDIAFVSTPSPMNPDGSCDTTYVERAIKQWSQHVGLFIIRSTVPPGTSERIERKYGVEVVFQPEYVGETLGHPNTQLSYDQFIILGGSPENTRKAADAWSRVLHPASRIRQVDHLTAELCKYMENSFLATKVIFVNQFRQLAETMGIDFTTLREAWLDDPRIGRSHTFAYKENPGFSGKCLPKDLNAITHYARQKGSPLKIIEQLLEINADMRRNVKTNVKLIPDSPVWKTDK